MKHFAPAGAFRLALALALALLAGACGPGVGGTGTGETASLAASLDAFGAAPASVCASDLAAQLACAGPANPGASASAGATPAAGTAPVFFADAGRGASLRVEGNRAELDAPCAGLRFGGEWGTRVGQTARFYGRTDAGLATLVAVPATSGLSVQVFDAQGRSLFGPQIVLPQAAAVVPACN